jgi:hypothetical protein
VLWAASACEFEIDIVVMMLGVASVACDLASREPAWENCGYFQLRLGQL